MNHLFAPSWRTVIRAARFAFRRREKPADTIADDPISNCRLLNTNEFRC
jgi:hypothetical protein